MTDDCIFQAAGGPAGLRRPLRRPRGGARRLRAGLAATSRTRNGATADTSSAAIAACPNGPSPAPGPTARASRPTARPVHLPRRPHRREERLPQGPPAPQGRLSHDTWFARTPTAREPQHGHDAATCQPLAAYDPHYDPLVAPTPATAATTRPPTGSATAGTPPDGRRPDPARHRRRRGDRRLGLHRAGHRALPGPRARHPRHRAGGQPQHLGLHQPQRRPGSERQRPAVPLAVDRALGQGDGAQARRRDPRRLRDLQGPGRRVPLRRRSPAATSTWRTARRRWISCATRPR